MIVRKKWLIEEIELLQSNYAVYGAKWCALKLGCPIRRVLDKVKKLGLKRRNDETQLCTKCQIIKPFSFYFRSKKGRNGLHAMCKQCFSKRDTTRYNSDSGFRLKKLLRRKYRVFFNQPRSIPAIFGCSLIDLHHHIEKQFTHGMSWTTYDWQIDHIIPLDILKNRQDKLHLVFNYRNHQPLSIQDNIGKSNDLQQAKEYLLKKIEMFGMDDFYREMIDFLDHC